jgi:WD40 repeat protein
MAEHIFISYERSRDQGFAGQLSNWLKQENFSVWLETENNKTVENRYEKTSEAIENSWVVIFIATPESAASAFCQQELNLALSQRKLVLPVIFRQTKLPPRLNHRRSISFTGDFDASAWQLRDYLVHLKGPARTKQVLRDLLIDLEKGLVPELKGYPDFVESEIRQLRSQLSANVDSITDKLSIEEPPEAVVAEPVSNSNSRCDWNGAPDVSEFSGRKKQLANLELNIKTEKCRLIGIFGMGGIGKTLLAIKLAQQIAGDFSFVIWRSLKNAPPLADLLKEYILFFSEQSAHELPENLSDRISLVINYLRENRCLIILDNVETILQGGTNSGYYREDYEGYAQLIQQIGEVPHKSLLILTSREKPKEFARLENSPAVKILLLSGVSGTEGKRVLKDKGINGTEEIWKQLVKKYSGNLLALKLASETIRELYSGNIAAFLSEGEAIFGDVLDVLDEQFARLSNQEQEIMYWLAIVRESIHIDDLRRNMISHPSKQSIMKSLVDLRRKSLIEQSSAGFTLQNVILEYITSRLVNNICHEIEHREIGYIANYSLIQAQAKDYIRQTQIYLILKPIAEQLLIKLEKEILEQKLIEMITFLQKTYSGKQGYAAGCILNILIYLQKDLRGLNFSKLSIWQAFLQNVNLTDIDFSDSDLSTSVFAETFRRVLSVDFSSDGKKLAAGTSDRKVIIWSVPDFKPIFTGEGHEDLVRCVVVNNGNNLLASGSSDRTVRLWDIESGACLKIFRGHTQMVNAVAFSPHDNILASCSADLTVRLWNINTGEQIRLLEGHTDFVSSIRYSPDGSFFATGSADKTIRLWDTVSGDIIAVLNGHSSRILSIAFSPDGTTIASGGEDHTVRLWSLDNRNCFAVWQGHLDSVWSVAFNKDGSTLASGSQDQTVRLWQVKSGECIKLLQGHTNHVRSVAFNSNLLASGARDSTIRIWNISSADTLKTIQGYSNSVWSVAFSPDGQSLASGNNDNNIYLWDVITGRNTHILKGHTNSVGAVSFSPDGKILASGSEDRTIRLWDKQTGRSMKILQGHTSWVNFVTFSPDGRLLASCSEDNTVRLWDMESGQALNILQGHTALVWTVDFSPDGSQLVSCSEDNTIRLWNTQTGQQIKEFQEPVEHMIHAVAFSSDGQKIACSGTDPTIRLWDVATGKQLNTLPGHSMLVLSIAFSSDGTTLVSSSVDQTVRLWDLSTGNCIRILRGHSGQIDSVDFSPDGKLIASGSADETIKLWETNSGKLIRTLQAQRLYEGMNITGVTGLTQTQKDSLKVLGAVESI